jgi:hypothetical protein
VPVPVVVVDHVVAAGGQLEAHARHQHPPRRPQEGVARPEHQVAQAVDAVRGGDAAVADLVVAAARDRQRGEQRRARPHAEGDVELQEGVVPAQLVVVAGQQVAGLERHLGPDHAIDLRAAGQARGHVRVAIRQLDLERAAAHETGGAAREHQAAGGIAGGDRRGQRQGGEDRRREGQGTQP